MSKKTKTWLVIAAFLAVIGGVIFGGVMMKLEWDFTKLSTVEYVSNDYEITENYRNITIVTDTADVVFAPSETATSSVVCYEQKNMVHTVAVRDGTLFIEIVDTRKWYEYIGIAFGSPQITVYMPQGEYGVLSVKSSTGDVTSDAFSWQEIKINTSTGNIRVENASVEMLDLSVSTGKVTVTDVTCEGDVKINVSTGKTSITDVRCKTVISNGNTGDILLQNVIAAEKFSIERSTGDVRFDGCDAADIVVKTDTGDVKGSLLSDKVFIARTDTGRINVPHTTRGGRCEITTDTGNITVNVVQ